MKHHRTVGSIVPKTKEELARALYKLLDTAIHNIADKNRWILDMDPSDRAVMSTRETTYAIFELKAAQAQDKAVEERTDEKRLHKILQHPWNVCSNEEHVGTRGLYR